MTEEILDPRQLRFDPPSVSLDVVAGVLADRYGVSGTLQPLQGERDQNTKVTTADGREFVLKIASPSEDPAVADLQCAALRHIADVDPGVGVPKVVPARDGADIVTVDVEATPAATRLLTFLRGVTFDDPGRLSLGELEGVGAAQGRLARAFVGFEHPAASNFMAWSLDSGMIRHPALWDGLSAEGHRTADGFRDRVEAAGGALTSGLDGVRRQVLHNDGHRGNLLRADDADATVTGTIDFGDIARTCVVADLAICVASFVDGRDDQPAAAAALAAGYDSWMDLTDPEIELLPDLVLTRIVLGQLLVEFQARHARPERLDEVVEDLSAYRTNMTAWGTLDVARTVDAIRRRVGERRTAVDGER